MRELLTLLLLFVTLAQAKPVHLRCDYLDNPLGIDSTAPRLSWQSDNTERNWTQSAYQILVATTPERLRTKPDVWDSGKQTSSESNGIVYGGPKLESRHQYYWTVRVWDAAGQSSDAEAPAHWEMGLLAKDDWSAKWICGKDVEDEADRAAPIKWIWIKGQDAFNLTAPQHAVFRLVVNLPQKPKSATLWLASPSPFAATVNAHAYPIRKNAREFDIIEVGDQLVAGKNTILISGSAAPKIGAVAALLKVTRADGTIERFTTDEHWESQDIRMAWQPVALIADRSDKRLGDPWHSNPASLLRRSFNVVGVVRSARVYVTALGSYRLFLNGKRVGNDILTPDWTDYRKRILYQTYDVTSLVGRGENVAAAMLGDGWYGSALGWTGARFNFGPPPPRLLMQLEIVSTNGLRQVFATDGGWKWIHAPILHSEIYAGETYDARQDRAGWDQPKFRDAGWAAASIADPPQAIVSSQMSPTIQLTETLKPKSVAETQKGTWVFDMGQNMVGWATLKVSGPAGTAVRMRFAETLTKSGDIYRDNLRGADATDTYILAGKGEETFEPHFTYHGFRYVELTGFPGKPTLDTIAGQVFHTAAQFTGKFTSSNPIVNQIWKNTLWGQRGNLESVPTDCPQRDERLGWMGDAQIFWRTASYNMDMAAFTHKFMRDVVEAQSPEGGFSDVSPRVIDERDGAPAWGDAGVIIPFNAWLQYGDRQIIEENWAAMERWMNYIASANPDFIRNNRRNNDFGDWVPANSITPKDLIATAYWAYDADLMSQMAHATGKEADAKRYADLFAAIRDAYQKKFINDQGEVGSQSQTSYALTLYMKLAPDALKQKIVDRLVKAVEQRNWHLSTGFLGTAYLLPALAQNSRPDVAYWLLGNDSYPSWGYMITKDATTMWERWNGDTGDPSMNSFNHYAFGSVVEWMYRFAGGIDTTTDGPGFRKIVIFPRTNSRMTHAHTEYDSVYGKIATDWTVGEKAVFSLDLTIPANTTATVYLPVERRSKVTEGGNPVEVQKGPEGYVTTTIGAGTYKFHVN